MGYATSSQPMVNFRGLTSVQGGTIPAELWHNYMAAALASEPQYGGTFPVVYSFPGQTLTPPTVGTTVLFPTTTTVPASSGSSRAVRGGRSQPRLRRRRRPRRRLGPRRPVLQPRRPAAGPAAVRAAVLAGGSTLRGRSVRPASARCAPTAPPPHRLAPTHPATRPLTTKWAHLDHPRTPPAPRLPHDAPTQHKVGTPRPSGQDPTRLMPLNVPNWPDRTHFAPPNPAGAPPTPRRAHSPQSGHTSTKWARSDPVNAT